MAMQRSDAMEYVTEIVQRSGTSFFWAMRVLPRPKCDAMFAIYAFCREVDDIADDPGDPAEKLSRLAEWRKEIDRLYRGEPSTPVTIALAGPVAEYGLPEAVFLEIISGMEIDAAARLRIADMNELESYCDKVACAVGRLSNRVFGVEESLGEAAAVALGQALQLTNILRDLHEDAELDRLYLPRDMLESHGIGNSASAGAALDHPAFGAACEELAGIAEGRYREAESALSACDSRIMRPAIVMMHVYRGIFRRLRRRGWNRLRDRVSVPIWQKLWILCRYGLT
jgi:phytoene synthase